MLRKMDQKEPIDLRGFAVIYDLKATILTFNYDTLLEEALEIVSGWHTRGEYFRRMEEWKMVQGWVFYLLKFGPPLPAIYVPVATTNHSWLPLEIRLKLLYRAFSVFEDCASIVSPDPAFTVTVVEELSVFLIKSIIPFCVFAAGRVSVIVPVVRRPKSEARRVVVLLTDLVFAATLPFTARVVLMVCVLSPSPHFACILPLTHSLR
jgi:hypothetical protein